MIDVTLYHSQLETLQEKINRKIDLRVDVILLFEKAFENKKLITKKLLQNEQ